MSMRRPARLASGSSGLVVVRVCGAFALGLIALAVLVSCGGASATHATAATRASKAASAPAVSGTSSATTSSTTTTKPASPPRPKPPAFPRVLPAALGTAPTPFVPAVSFGGQVAAWVARSTSGVSLLSLDQRLVELHLHSGTVDAGTLDWRWGPTVSGSERRLLIAAFNGGFKLATHAGGFMSYGRVAVPLGGGLGSIVTYADGHTDIGSWQGEVPAPSQRVLSVRQNLALLVDHGVAAANADCVICWGATLGGVSAPARSALGITADGHLIWAGGEHLTPSQLAAALIEARVVRAVELDINPEWVAAYVYGHRGGAGPLAPVAVLATQHGIPGMLLAPYSRDFFTVVGRPL